MTGSKKRGPEESPYLSTSSLGPEFEPEQPTSPMPEPVPVPERFPTHSDLENLGMEREYWKIKYETAMCKIDLMKLEYSSPASVLVEAIEKEYKDYRDMRLKEIEGLLDGKLTLEKAIDRVKDFLVSAGWKIYTISSAEPVYRIVVNGSMFEPKKEMEIILDQKGHYIKLGIVDDLR